MPIILVDPTSSIRPEKINPAPRPVAHEKPIVALLSNGKPNADLILAGVLKAMDAQSGKTSNFEAYTKQHASRIASTELVNQIARRCHFAIVGIGD